MNKKIKKIKLRVLAALVALFSVFSMFGINNVNADAPQVKAISLTTYLKLLDVDNVAGEPQKSFSGETVYTYGGFHTQEGGTGLPEKSMVFRLKMPKGSEVSHAKNSVFHSVKGNADNPEEVNDDANYDYQWFIWDEAVHPGQVKDFLFKIKPSFNGITENDAKIPLELKAYTFDNDTNKVIDELSGSTATNYFENVTDKFGWNNVSNSFNTGLQETSSSSLPNDYKITFSSTSKYGENDYGMSYAKSFNFENIIEIPLSSNNQPYLLITADNLYNADGSDKLDASEYEILEKVSINSVEYITKVKIKQTVTNSNYPDAEGNYKELNATASIMIKDSALNTATILNDDKLAAGESADYVIKVVDGSNNKVTPAVNVKDINKDSQDVAATTGTTTIRFKNIRKTGEESNKNPFTKKIVKIGSSDATNSSPGAISAFANDLITYEIGEGFTNLQGKALDNITFIDGGYTINQMHPVEIKTGEYDNLGTSATLEVYGSTDGGNTYSIVKTFSNSDLSNNVDFTFPTSPVTKYDHLKLVYKNLPDGFKIKSAPQLMYQVEDRTDAVAHMEKVENDATMTYSYKIDDSDPQAYTSEEKKSSTFFTYKILSTDENGRYSSNKSAINLKNNQEPVYSRMSANFDKGDVWLFTITYKNITNTTIDMTDYTIDDEFTPNLSPYSGENTTVDGSTSIDSKYLNSSVNSNMILWDPVNPTQKYPSDVSVTTSGDSYKIKMPDNFLLGPQQTVNITYTMSIDDDYVDAQTLGNEYDVLNPSNGVVAQGELWVSIPPCYKIENTSVCVIPVNYNKTVANVTKETAPTTLPAVGEAIAYTVTLTNTTNRTMTNVKLVDKYDEILDPYNEKALLHAADTEYPDYEKLINSTSTKLNMAFGARTSTTISLANLNIDLDSNRANNEFVVDINSISLKPGERIELVYTMIVNSKAQPGQTFDNYFYAYENGDALFYQGHRQWRIDPNQDKDGIVDVVKKASGITVDGDKPNTNMLIHGEKLEYRVDIGNYHSRLNKIIDLTTIKDRMPSNLVLDESTIKVEKVIINADGTETKTPFTDFVTEVDIATDPKETVFQVNLNNPIQLESELITLANGSTVAKNRVYLTYEVTVDTESDRFSFDDSTAQTIIRKNYAYAYFKQESTDLVVKSGNSLVQDAGDTDKNAESKTYVLNNTAVKIYNDKILSGAINKATLNEVNVSTTDLTRGYTLTIKNNSLAPMNLAKIVDILPEYEKMDTNITPKIEVYDTKGDLVGEYTLNYQEDDSYLNASGDTQKRVIFTSYENSGTKPLSVLKAETKKEGENITILPTKIVLKYSTVVDGETVIKDFKAAEDNKTTKLNQAALYLRDNDAVLTLEANGGQALADDSLEDNGANNWDSNPDTKVRYASSSNAVTIANSISPFVNIKAQMVEDLGAGAEKYNDYNKDTDGITPGDYVAYKINYGNANTANLDLLSGAKVVAILPSGITYAGLQRDTSGNEIVPSGLSNGGVPTITTLSDGRQVLVWDTTEDLHPAVSASDEREFVFRTNTKPNVFAQYGVESYVVPKNDVTQFFYEKIIKSSVQYTSKYKYEQASRDISALLPEYKGVTRFVETSAPIDVYGMLHISTEYSVEEKALSSNIAKSSASNKIISIPTRDDEVTYDMEIVTKVQSKGLKELVLINRLADLNDLTLTTSRERESEAKIRLDGNGNFKGKVVETGTNTPDSNYDDSLLTIEYFVGAANEEFSVADWSGVSSSKWLSESDLLAAGYDFDDVSAFRIIVDPTYVVSPGHKLNIRFDAKLKDYKISNKVGYGSFGFRGTVNSLAEDEVLLEPIKVGVKTVVPFDRAIITKVLNDSSDTPKVKTFTVNLLKIDKVTKATVDSTTHKVTVDRKEGNKWVGTVNVYDLDKNYNYVITEKVPNHFLVPVYSSVSKLQDDGAVEWALKVINTPEKTLWVKYHANGGKDAPIDSIDYYNGDTVKVKKRENTTRENYKFIGWNTRKDGKGTWYHKDKNAKVSSSATASFTIVKNTTLYAQWEKDSSGISKGGSESLFLAMIALVTTIGASGFYIYQKRYTN
ncbi:putative repeat protein (TIGR01451 family) [Bacilli bacterium PM5-9]|nr:putative repeat protein (TIGR01451 family) [Bacilli bacterium PM5-9]